ncbi:MAG: proton-conducting transporter membrane subunit [Vulcanimicrobiota bacterium]
MAWLSKLTLCLSAGLGHGRGIPSARRRGMVGAALALVAGLFTASWWLGLVGLLAVGLASQPRTTTRSLVYTQLLLATGWLGAAGQPLAAGALGWLLMYRFSPSRGLALAGLLSSLSVGAGLACEQPELVAVGLAVRLGLVPLHSWLLNSFERGPTPVAVAFLGAGLVVVHDAVGWMGPLGALTMLSGAVLASAQSRLRRTVACLVLSQVGMLAMAVGWAPGAVGTLVVLLAVATVSWALCAELVEVRYGEDPRLDRFAASFEAMPRLSTAFLFSGLVAVGLPGTLGYVAEDLLVQPLVHHQAGFALALLGASALNAVTLARAVFHLFSGPLPRGPGCDLLPREMVLLTLAFGVLAAVGFCPQNL